MSRRIRVEVDRASLLDLARGANLYEDGFSCVRELLANAADATLLRLFVERGAETFPTNERSLADLRAVLVDRPIDVSVEAHEAFVRVVVRDRGTGIAEADLPFLATLGGSTRNEARRALTLAMPEWMRPTGTFGIGLHSVFLVTDVLAMRSTHHTTGATLAIRLVRDDDGVSIEVEPGEALAGGGTEAVFDVPRAGLGRPPHWVTSMAPFVAADKRDPVLEPRPDVAVLSASLVVRACALGSIVPVRLAGELLPPAFDVAHAVFDPALGVEIAWRDDARVGTPTWQPARERGHAEAPSVFYRGAPVGARLGHFPLALNVHAGAARELLRLSRDDLTAAGRERVTSLRTAAIRSVAPRWLDPSDPVCAPAAMRPWVSRLLLSKGSPRASEAWKELFVAHTVGGERLTLGQVASCAYISILSGDGVRVVGHQPDFETTVDDQWAMYSDVGLFFPNVEVASWPDRPNGLPLTEYWRRRGVRGCARAAFHGQLRHTLRRPQRPRPFLHAPHAYPELFLDRVRLEALAPWPVEIVGRFLPQLLLPFVIDGTRLTAPGFARWARFVVELAGEPRALADVALAGLRFVVEHEPVVRAIEGLEVELDPSALREELVRELAVELPGLDEIRAAVPAT